MRSEQSALEAASKTAGVRSVHLRFAAGYPCAAAGPGWHTPPLVMRRADGAVEVIGQAGDWAGAVRYALSFGTCVEVIGPSALREAVAEEARRMAKLYESPCT